MENEIEILSVNISTDSGPVGKPVSYINTKDSGILYDARKKGGYRQVSMLDSNSMNIGSRENVYGKFGEDITVKGLENLKPKIFDRFYNDNIDLEVTGIGETLQKTEKSDRKQGDKSLMSDKGIYLRIVRSGKLKPGDRLIHQPKEFRIQIITVSDRASKGIYEDLSGPEIAGLAQDFFTGIERKSTTGITIIPDDPDLIKRTVKDALDQNSDIIFTTGGTGIGPKDYTPDVIDKMLDKEISGIMEMIRVKYGMEKPNALLSRSVAGTIGTTLVYVLPGSVKAVREYCQEIFRTVNHSMLMLHGIGDH